MHEEKKESRRPAFEQAVIDRMKEGGFLEVEIRVECLARSGDGYYDGSVDAYWHFWNAALDGVVIELPHPVPSICKAGKGRGDEVTFHLLNKEGDPIGGEPQDHCMDCTRPVQQVSVPDEWNDGYRAAMNSAASGARQLYVQHCHHHGANGLLDRCKELEQSFIRDADAMLAAAPAAPAADDGLVEALDYQVLFDAIAAATSVYANGAINISVQAFRESLAAALSAGKERE